MTRNRARRRAFLRAGLLGGAALLLGGHTPYRQWVVYRKKHLLIGCHKKDPRTYELAKRAVTVLDMHLPAAKARVARAPFAGRLASLLGTDQMEVAIVGAADAAAMLSGSGAFEAYGPVALRLLLPVADRWLICREDFPERHAWLVAEALADSELVERDAVPADPSPAWHPGSRAFLDGRPEPTG